MQTFVVISDAHLEHGIDADPSYNLAKRFIKWLRPDTIYLNGDMLDLSYLSSYNETAELLREGKRLQQDFDLFNKELDYYQKYSRRVIYLEGNHENRAQRVINRFANFGELLSIPHNLHLNDRHIDWIGESKQPVKISSNLSIAHGFYFGVHYAKKTAEQVGDTIIVGHTHRRQEYSFSYLSGRSVTCHGLGCLSDLRPPYLKGKPSGWSNGFGVGYVNGNEHSFYNILVNDGFIWGGKQWR